MPVYSDVRGLSNEGYHNAVIGAFDTIAPLLNDAPPPQPWLPCIKDSLAALHCIGSWTDANQHEENVLLAMERMAEILAVYRNPI